MTSKYLMWDNLPRLKTVWQGVYQFFYISSSVALAYIHHEFYLNEMCFKYLLKVYYKTNPRTRITILGPIVKIKVWSNIGYIGFGLVV